jgi:hypothetical protein
MTLKIMALKYYHILIIIFTLSPLISRCQEVNDYRLEYGLSFGYRSYNLDDANRTISFINQNESIKPDHGSAALSADIKGRPFKTKPFFLNFRFDFLPDNIGNYSQEFNNPVYISQSQKSVPPDTVTGYQVLASSIRTTMFFASMMAGTDISLGRFNASIGCGAVYGFFAMNVLQGHQNFWKLNQGLYYPDKPYFDQESYQTKNNFGFIASGKLSYPLLSRLSANLSFSVILLDPEVTFLNGTIWEQDGYFGLRDFGFYYPRVLTAGLSGIQVTTGLSYILF